MILVYTTKLNVKICYANVEAQKIDGFTFETFKIVLISLWIEDKLKRILFFQKRVLLVATSIRIMLKMFF